jgi:hypothetical protein
VFDVNSHVKPAVIPIRVMLSAPIPVGVHAVDITSHLPTIVAVFRCVAIDACSIGFQFPVAVVAHIAKRNVRG